MKIFKHYTHNDLDGYGCEFVVRYFLKKYKGDEYYKSYQCIHLNYKDIDDYIFKNCLVTDLKVEKQRLKRIKENVIFIDHHDYSKKELKIIEILKRKNKFILDKNKSSTKLTFQYFNNKKDISEIKEFIELIDTFDLWKTNSPLWKKAFMINELFERRQENKKLLFLQDVFENGLKNFKDEYKQILKNKNEFIKKLRSENKVFEYDNTILYLSGTYEYLNFLNFETKHKHKIFLISPTKLSIRHIYPSLEKVEKALKDIPNITYGGHQEAQGVTILNENNKETLYEVIEALIKEFEK